ncbi:acetate/propionate family kinase [Slackia isoflavoniconvertens]|mgnify:CR=1 FL=1|uniref:acetate/propionate family kinase n=1 Tax=Slackia isoflavoniconvertens TaxID=572010 RepID=UPI003AF1635C
MKILVINAGSSSLKYQLIDTENNKMLAKGLCERVGSKDSYIKHGADKDERIFAQYMADHEEALAVVFDALCHSERSTIHSINEIDAIGHRIVHGGNYFDSSVLITPDVIKKIESLCTLAPLHNPPALKCINVCQSMAPDMPQVAVFDTSFFQSLPPSAYMYPLPYELCEKHQIRKYGAHGTSHRYIAQRCAALMEQPIEDLKIITCHLGNGCSISAVDHGIAVDTSMGFTPLDGLMMGTRCGAIDPAIIPFLEEAEDLTPPQINELMNKKSGLLGVSGISNDMRDVRKGAEEGNERAVLAYEMYAHSIRKYLGQYLVEMAGCDAIVLTAGVGENCDRMRRIVFAGLQPLGIILDQEKNRRDYHGKERFISRDDSPVKIIVIPTNEEFMIAQDTLSIVSHLKK